MKTKKCSKCKQKKLLSSFHKNQHFKDNYHNRCKECCKEDREYQSIPSNIQRGVIETTVLPKDIRNEIEKLFTGINQFQ